MSLNEKLKSVGCSHQFINESQEFSSFYTGDIEQYINYVENQLDTSFKEDSEYIDIDNEGIRISEIQYNGDAFTMHGYDLSFNNSRY